MTRHAFAFRLPSWTWGALAMVVTTAAHGQLAIPAAASAPASASAPGTGAELPTIKVLGNYENGIGTSDAASQGAVTSQLVQSRPTLRPAELLEFVPGVIVTQHSGDGKANQYFLRGFNLDHGTDFATFVDGMPVNMPTHAHGQGYSDLNWLMPEIVGRIDYRKGPYAAEDGDFASAGTARFGLMDKLTRGIASMTLGENGYVRSFLADSIDFKDGSLLYALEASHNNGPWTSPEQARKLNGVLRYAWGGEGARSSITGMAYSSRWNASDQVPARAVAGGLIDRFGTIDPSDGGRTSRYSLSYATDRAMGNGRLKVNAYLIRSRLDLYSDFTYNLDNPSPVNADQFEQAEHRTVIGGSVSRSMDAKLAGLDMTNTVGVQWRQDRLSPVGLYASLDRQRTGTFQEAAVRETMLGVYGENATQWLPWLRSVAGVRIDQARFNVNSSIAQNSGRATATIASPKLSLIFGPWKKTEYFVNAGYGFHSNDARGVTSTLAARELTPVDPSPALVRTKGGEVGVRSELVPGLQSSLSLWMLTLGSELVFSGDAGDTEPSGASRRQGIELNNHYRAARWLLFDFDLAASRARFRSPQGDAPNLGTYVPGAVDRVASLGATVLDVGPWSGQLQLRYFGPRPLIEDNSRHSSSSTLVNARVGYRLSRDVRLSLDVFNVFNRKVSDIDYWYTSRLPGEPAGGVADYHFHPAEPRTVRVSLALSF